MAKIKQPLRQEITDGRQEASAPLRIASARPIANRMIRRTLEEIDKLERALLDGVLSGAAERRGEEPPSYARMRRALSRDKAAPAEVHQHGAKEKRGDLDPADLLQILAEVSASLTADEIEATLRLFYAASDEIRGIFEQGLGAAYQDGLDVSYARMSRTARPQNPQRFADVDPALRMNPQSPFVRSFLDRGLERITSKLTRHFYGTAMQTISSGLTSGGNWASIARELHRTVGVGARWHWVRLVRTEVQFAYNYSARERATLAGIEYEQLSVSRAACPICIDAQGIYILGQGPVIPLHPNCRCTWIHFYRLPKGAVVRGAYVAG